MDLYNRSLCYAKVGTSNVALAYSNRSACFFHMRMYDEALVDIELAKKANISDHLIPKLEHCEQESRTLRRIQKTPSKRPCQLSYESDDDFPCMVDVIKIKYNQELGRHLIATRNIPAGETILLEDSYVMAREDDRLVCHTCYRGNANFIACEHCPDAIFCSTYCKNTNPTHKWECDTFFEMVEIDMKFHIRAILIAIDTFANVADLMQFVDHTLLEDSQNLPTSMHNPLSKYHFFFKLQKSEPKSSEVLLDISTLYRSMIELPKIASVFNTLRKQRFLMHLVAHHFFVASNNSIGNDSNTTIANIHSLLSHSCAPNTATYAAGNQRFSITIRPIRKGQPLYMNYLHSIDDKPLNIRQAELKSGWGFTCKCENCVAGDKPINIKHMMTDPCTRFLLINYSIEENYPIVLETCLKLLKKYKNQRWTIEMQIVAGILARIYKQMFSF
ncbi:SET and MYND domain-containing protein 4-like [Sitodiplosis mosellana]|uniref:SET and MYND domain-containing protein 4-like n=1 Tax=Sitodiplosis mosellana TaxID=263140 RepID=UPI002443B091|nr:SET and MYND domain-containing protein 4-like [Sitodiplosis mosellana]